MHSLFGFVLFAFLSKFVFADTAADNRINCQNLIDCLEKLNQKEAECKDLGGNQTSPVLPKNPTPFQTCNIKARDREVQIREKDNARIKQLQSCLKSRLDDAEPVDAKKQDTCRGALAKKIDNSTNSRSKRDATTKKPDTDKKTEAKEKAAREKAAREESNKKMKQCQEQLQNQRRACGAVAQCCSEKNICDLQFESSSANTDLKKLQLDNALQRRECNKLKPKTMETSGTGSNTTQSSA